MNCQPTPDARTRAERAMLAGMGLDTEKVRILPPPRCRSCGGGWSPGPFPSEMACMACRIVWPVYNQ